MYEFHVFLFLLFLFKVEFQKTRRKEAEKSDVLKKNFVYTNLASAVECESDKDRNTSRTQRAFRLLLLAHVSTEAHSARHSVAS
jgi:hypothetical protein